MTEPADIQPVRVHPGGRRPLTAQEFARDFFGPGGAPRRTEPLTVKQALADVHAYACSADQHDPICSLLSDAIVGSAARLADARALVSDWQANGNSRSLGDPRADVWHKCAAQLLAVVDLTTGDPS